MGSSNKFLSIGPGFSRPRIILNPEINAFKPSYQSPFPYDHHPQDKALPYFYIKAELKKEKIRFLERLAKYFLIAFLATQIKHSGIIDLIVRALNQLL